MVSSVVNRYYDTATDQFLSIDPDVATTDQPYVFSNDDPLNTEDPLGLEPGTWMKYGANWPTGDLQNAIRSYLGNNIAVEQGSNSSKIVFIDVDDPAKQIVYDVPANAYRIARASNGVTKYYDRTNDSWGTDKSLGEEGLANSHYSNTGDSYSSVDDAYQQLIETSYYSGDGEGDDTGGSVGSGMLFMIFPSVCQLLPSACNSKKSVQT